MERKSLVSHTVRTAFYVAVVLGVIVLAYLGQRLSPMAQTPVGGDIRKAGCDVDAPQALHAAAKKWCAVGLFSRVDVTGDDKHVIAVMRLSPNGAQTWQLQNGLLVAEFRGLAEQMASQTGGRDLSIALHDAAGRRVGACARATSDAPVTCTNE